MVPADWIDTRPLAYADDAIDTLEPSKAKPLDENEPPTSPVLPIETSPMNPDFPADNAFEQTPRLPIETEPFIIDELPIETQDPPI